MTENLWPASQIKYNGTSFFGGTDKGPWVNTTLNFPQKNFSAFSAFYIWKPDPFGLEKKKMLGGAYYNISFLI